MQVTVDNEARQIATGVILLKKTPVTSSCKNESALIVKGSLISNLFPTAIPRQYRARNVQYLMRKTL